MFNTRKAELSVRADRRKLASNGTPTFEQVLASEADTDGWRIVELSSFEGLPFDVELTWSSANGSGARVLLTVPHATRLCVFARTLKVRARNLAPSRNTVGATIADGYAETRNQLEVRVHDHTLPKSAGFAAPVTVKVPPFATTAWVESADPSEDGFIHILDAVGAHRGTTRITEQPDGGIPVGGARELQLWMGHTPLRVVFRLGV